MRIGIVTHNYSITREDKKNAGIFVADFASALNKKMPVFIFQLHLPESALTPRHVFNPFSVVRLIDLLKKGTDDCARFVEENKIDFLIAMWALPAGLIAAHVKKKHTIPYAIWSLGSDINTYAHMPIIKNLVINALFNADVLFSNSRLVCQKVEKLSHKSCHLLPAVTDFSTTNIKPKKLDPTKYHFLFVGRLEKIKGADLLIQAAQMLKKHKDTFMIHILGDGRERARLEKMVQKFSIEEHVHFLGNVSRKTVVAYMLGSDALVITSRSESLPLVFLEAMRAGLPIISTDVGDCKRLINKYNAGLLINGKDYKTIATSMEKAIIKKPTVESQYLPKYTMEYAVNTFIKFIPSRP